MESDRPPCLPNCLPNSVPACLVAAAAYLLYRLAVRSFLRSFVRSFVCPLCIAIDLYVKNDLHKFGPTLIDLLSGTYAFLNAGGVGTCEGQNTPCSSSPEKVRLSM